MSRQRLNKLIAECVGTFALVFAGCGAIVTNELSNGVITHPGIALVFGLVVMVMIYATGHISGAHFNPAVTLAFAACRRFPWSETPGYIGSQCVGAVLGSLALKVLFSHSSALGSTVIHLPLANAFITEVIITAILMFVIMAVATDARAAGLMAGVAIGGTVACAALMAGPLTGASMNPARSLGPALISGHLTHLAVYLTAPFVGALLGGGLYMTIRCEIDTEPEDVSGCC
ncbi:MAG: MIP family channel protein [Myxococcota bacterium]|nr:MIP family channel protein [Myxococcota bacterium]